MAHWSIYLLRGRTLSIYRRPGYCGTVEAANEKQAIDGAIKQFNIEPARRNRIVATKNNGRCKRGWLREVARRAGFARTTARREKNSQQEGDNETMAVNMPRGDG